MKFVILISHQFYGSVYVTSITPQVDFVKEREKAMVFDSVDLATDGIKLIKDVYPNYNCSWSALN